MLDLVFLVLMLIVMINAVRGKFLETVCNVATVVGIIAALIGLISAFIRGKSYNPAPFVLNIILLLIAVSLRRFAMLFVKQHEEKVREEEAKMLAIATRYSRDSAEGKPPVYTDESFDDPELRFGKGGYTDNDL